MQNTQLRKAIYLGFAIGLTTISPSGVHGQAVPAPIISALAQGPAPRDTPASLAHEAAARKAAGSRWAAAYAYLCKPGDRVFNRPTDLAIEPVRIFDNLSLVGDRGTLVFVLTTSEGAVLIDASYPGKTESVVVPGLITLGLDPRTVKYILVTHGHADHYGGAAYFRQHYGTRIVASKADWALIEAGRGPSPDIVVGDGDVLTIGDLEVHTFLIPGHTAGALGFIFPVREGKRVRMAGLFGGTILADDRISNEGLRQYVDSVRHFADASRRLGVEVELQSHPLFDDTHSKAGSRKVGELNPFVVGRAGYQDFLAVISECIQASLSRRDVTAPAHD